MNKYTYRPKVTATDFSESMEELKRRGYKVIGSAVDNASPAIVHRILDIARDCGMDFIAHDIDLKDFERYWTAAGYGNRYRDYYHDNQPEKALEHYIALRLLNLNRDDIFIDVASEHSPVPEIYTRLVGTRSFSQDIMYPEAIDGNRIGGDACSMPVPDGFASKAALTCSLEHFEEYADTNLFLELFRVLKPGGAVCIVPFYLYVESATQTDPTLAAPFGVTFDADSTIYCAEGWGNRHARFYSPESFGERIMDPARNQFKFDFYYLRNAAELNASVYVRFAFVATRL